MILLAIVNMFLLVFGFLIGLRKQESLVSDEPEGALAMGQVGETQKG